VDTVRRVVNQIIRNGKVVKPTLGVNIADDRVLRSIEMQLKKELNGVLVVEVLPGSPAEKAGMKTSTLRSDSSIVLGDLITEINGEKIVCVEDLLTAIEARSEGETVTVTVMRKCDRRLVEKLSVKLTSSDKLKNDSATRKKAAWQ
jgi:S1-C subfamily serine protease